MFKFCQNHVLRIFLKIFMKKLIKLFIIYLFYEPSVAEEKQVFEFSEDEFKTLC